MVDMKKIRNSSVSELKSFNMEYNLDLPLIEIQTIKHIDEICARICILNVLVAYSYSYSKEKALCWLSENKLLSNLTDTEKGLLEKTLNKHDKCKIQLQIESLWALAWSVNLVEDISFRNNCGSNLSNLLPKLWLNETQLEFRKKINIREKYEIATQCDLYYCVHWWLIEYILKKNKQSKINEENIIARRVAFEWLISDKLWDEIELDT